MAVFLNFFYFFPVFLEKMSILRFDIELKREKSLQMVKIVRKNGDFFAKKFLLASLFCRKVKLNGV